MQIAVDDANFDPEKVKIFVSRDGGKETDITKKDKKMEQGQIKFILMDGLGKSFIDKTVTDQELLVGIHAICKNE